MKALRVGLIVRDREHIRRRDDRIVGQFSYPVDEFAWEHLAPGAGFSLSRADYRDYDVLVLEDGLFGSFYGNGPPVVVVVTDSTISRDHYKIREKVAKQADLILVDHDHLAGLGETGKPVRRWAHCVNDRLFKDYGMERDWDVSFVANIRNCPERVAVADFLRGKLDSHGWRAGKIGPVSDSVQYAKAFNRSRITVNVNRTQTNRAHRILDALACRVCLMTSPLPFVSGEELVHGQHLVEFRNEQHMLGWMEHLILTGEWQSYADVGYREVTTKHTWQVRARQLRDILNKELGL